MTYIYSIVLHFEVEATGLIFLLIVGVFLFKALYSSTIVQNKFAVNQTNNISSALGMQLQYLYLTLERTGSDWYLDSAHPV
jgi:hypothetical protein